MTAGEILCVGEILWDSLPAGLFLGGSPFNVACHLRAIGAPAAIVSRVGRDRLGEEARRRARALGVDITLLQEDDALATGFAGVTVDARGDSTFAIVAPAAWDAIAASDALLARAAHASAVVFGSLAQRAAPTRATIERVLSAARDATLVFDVNLRAPYDDRAIVERSLHRARIVKVNEGEMATLAEWFGLPDAGEAAARALAAAFECDVVCITRARAGAGLLRDGAWCEHPGFDVPVVDTVGAGDAFLAVLVAGLLAGAPTAALLERANRTGAWVVTQAGAVPAGAGLDM